jgi:nucleoid-associated protein YgaU
MSQSQQLEKAEVQILNGKRKNDTITCLFNPQEYQIKSSVDYSEHDTLLDTPPTQYASNSPDVLSMELFFDTTKKQEDVRTHTDAVNSLLEVDGELHAPPLCRFTWGGGLNFTAFLQQAQTKYTKFLPSGVPVRARMNVEFREYESVEFQKSEIKHESTDKSKIWTVTEGDTLWLIAEEEYGDPSHWRTIAQANDIENPRALDPGTNLSLPPL